MKSLKAYNTFGIEASCNNLIEFDSTNILDQFFQESLNYQEPFLILGGGSNILFTDHFNGTVLLNQIKGIQILEENNESVLVEIGGGEVWHDFVLWAINNEYGGIENMSLIPGSVGAAPMQNIGAYGVEIKDVFHSLEAYEIKNKESKTFTKADCKFGYRESVFKRSLKNQFIITHVRLNLTKKGFHKLNTSYGMIQNELSSSGISSPNIRDISDAVIKIRQSKLPDPKEIGNSGSFFKNPILPKEQISELKEKFPDLPVYPVDEKHSKTAAGWLIDQAGWKGFRQDDFGVHKKQALVLVNYGKAKGADIFDLSEKIIQSIKEKYGIELEREVNIY